jgi:hypothetical protein
MQKIRFMTSLSPNRIEVQKRAILTWRLGASDIIAIQTPENIEKLAPHFPDVTFVERKIPPEKYPHLPNRVTIGELVSYGPGLLINSDCELTGWEGWEYEPRTLKVGVRHEYRKAPDRKDKVAPCGIDLFLISPDVKEHWEEHGFVLGTSVWDIWMPWHYLTLRFKIVRVQNHRINHERHKSEWDERETEIGNRILKEGYGIRHKTAAYTTMCETWRMD